MSDTPITTLSEQIKAATLVEELRSELTVALRDYDNVLYSTIEKAADYIAFHEKREADLMILAIFAITPVIV